MTNQNEILWNNNRARGGHYWLVGMIMVALSVLSVVSLKGQDVSLRPVPDTPKTTTIILDEPADRIRLFTKDSVQYQVLVGNVRMRHDSTFMRTDSAILDDRNKVEAYGNVVIQELDSTHIFADTLWYNGDTRLAELKGDVVLEKGEQKLFTSHLLYDLNNRIARYSQKSFMLDGGMQLSSLRGVFYVNEDRVIFQDSVVVISDSFNLKADSMAFFTQEHRVKFLGPTVVYDDSSRLYAENGYYLLDKDEALFYNFAQFESGETSGHADSIFYFGNEGRYEMIGKAFIKKDDQVATAKKIIYNEREGLLYLYQDAVVKGDDVNASGDTLIYNTETKAVRSRGRSRVERNDFTLQSEFLDYNDETQLGFASGNVIWEDSSGMKRIYSDSLQYSNDGQSARAIPLKKRPLFEWSSEDGDTLRLISDTLFTYQSIISGKDTLNQVKNDTVQDFSAYHGVAILRGEMQGRADSLAYKESDSVIILYGTPILWMDTTQLSGDTIFISILEGEIKDVLIKGNAFIITSPDSIYFNQIKGREITAYFNNGDIYQADVDGNAESIYFPLDDAGGYIAMNKIICSRIEMFFEDRNVTGVSFLEDPEGELISMKEVNTENSILKGYQNLNHLRPGDIEKERVLKMGKPVSLNPALNQ